MWGPGEDTMWQEFQLYAGRGFGIVYCNPRGSGGYGYGFKHANYQNWGEDPGEDVLAVATEAAKEPWIDPSKQVLTGGSYAGYLTAWIIGHDNRFKAAVAQRVRELGQPLAAKARVETRSVQRSEPNVLEHELSGGPDDDDGYPPPTPEERQEMENYLKREKEGDRFSFESLLSDELRLDRDEESSGRRKEK